MDVLTAFEVRFLLTGEEDGLNGILSVVHIVIIGVSDSHIIIGLMVDQGRVVGGGELIVGNHETVGDAGIGAFDLQAGNNGLDSVVVFIVDKV